MAAPNGVVIYQGPSEIDGAPIVVVATGLAKGSTNTKTGAMIQTWILRQDVDPVRATHTGQDESICGACPHRGTIEGGRNKGRSCYVTVFQAPLNVWRSWKRGIYPVASLDQLAEIFAGRILRLGSYGDPGAVPLPVLAASTSRALAVNGYTHQWRARPELASWCMASADSTEERAAAKLLGFRTFRVGRLGEVRQAGEIACPASAESGHRTTCADCRACGGLSARAKRDVVIQVHGARAKINAYEGRA